MSTATARDTATSRLNLVTVDFDPSVAPGLDPNPDPDSVLIVRTDVPSLYRKSGGAATDCVQIASGGAGSIIARQTTAQVAAEAGPSASDPQFVFIGEFSAIWKWNAGSAVAADNVRVIAPTGGVAGRWILDGTMITLTPIGGGANDWVRVAAAWTSMAGFGKVILNGAFVCTTNETIPQNAYVEFTPGSSVAMNLAPSPGFAGSPFFKQATNLALTTLAVASVAGDVSQQLTSAVGFAIGNYVTVRMTVNELYRYSRRIINIVGNTVTYDRPLERPFPAGASTEIVSHVTSSVPKNITIIGNGVVFTGTGDTIVQLIATWDTYVERIIDDTTSLTICPFNFDVASRDSKFVLCKANGKGITPGNFLIDSGENCVIEDCDGRGALNNALQINSSDNIRVIRGTFSDGAGSGLLLDILGVGGVPLGSRGCYFEGTAFLRFNNGSLIQNGSSFNTFVGVDSSYNTVAGHNLSAGASPPNGNVFKGGRVQGNGQTGIAAGAGENRAEGMNYIDNVGSAVLCSAGGIFNAIGGEVIDTSTAALLGVGNLHSTGAGSRLTVDGVQGSSNRAIHHFCIVEADGYLEICGGTRFTSGAANQIAFLMNGASKARVDEFTTVGACLAGIFLNNAAAFCRVGRLIDVSSSITPINIVAGNINRGRIALTAAVALAIAFGDTNVQDQFHWSYETNVGALGVVIAGAPIVGTGFNIVALAGDTSIINWHIDP